MSGWEPRFFERSARFAPIAAAAARFVEFRDWPEVSELDRRLAGAAGVRFVAAEKGPGYETRIVEAGEVPTRFGNWHDFLNALVWVVFPLAKRSLSERLLSLQRGRGGPGNRSREEDWLALYDEGGVVIRGGEEIVFGHAVYEHLIRGEAVRGLGLVVEGAQLDAALAAALAGPFGGRTFRVVVGP